MKKIYYLISMFLIFFFILTACNRELKNIIEKDLIIFEEEYISEEFLNELSDYDVIMLGEYHGVREHNELVVELMIQLHQQSGFNQLLLETPHALNWILEDYSTGIIDSLPQFFTTMGMMDLKRIKNYNYGLSSSGEGINVNAYDINHNPSFLRLSFDFLLEMNILEETEDIKKLLQIFVDKSEEILTDEIIFIKEVQSFIEKLEENYDHYTNSWGNHWYERIMEILKYEIISYNCRKHLADNDVQKRTKLRENVMKELVDNYLKENSEGTLINTGLNHAQKNHYRGIENEWLAEYLVYRSGYARGNTYIIAVIPAKGQLEWGKMGDYRNINLVTDSNRNELFRLIYEATSGQHSFLPLHHPLFKNQKLNLNFHFETIKAIPVQLHDGIYLLPKISPSR